MSEPASFAIIRDGQQRYYVDRWASACLHRELVWGPEALETWILTLNEINDWYDEGYSGVVIDFDKRRLIWSADAAALSIPRVASVYNQLLAKAWPKYEIICDSRGDQLTEALGLSTQADVEHEPLKIEHRILERRPATIRDASSDEDDCDSSDEDIGDEMDHDDTQTTSEALTYEFGDDELRAWVTVTDSAGSIRHRQIPEISQDLLKSSPQVLTELKALSPSEVPKEEVVREGMWIEEAERTIGVWGGAATKAALPLIEQSWKGWDVQWAPRGYQQHCAATGPTGQPMSTEQALAKLVPTILSTARFDMSMILGAIGGSLKKTAAKATGCLLAVVCSPLLIFGAVSGNWKAVLITVGIVITLAVIVFKLIERRVAKSFKGKLRESEGKPAGPATAGPLDPDARRQALDQLLTAAGFPSVKELEAFFPPKDELDLPG